MTQRTGYKYDRENFLAGAEISTFGYLGQNINQCNFFKNILENYYHQPEPWISLYFQGFIVSIFLEIHPLKILRVRILDRINGMAKCLTYHTRQENDSVSVWRWTNIVEIIRLSSQHQNTNIIQIMLSSQDHHLLSNETRLPSKISWNIWIILTHFFVSTNKFSQMLGHNQLFVLKVPH